MLNEHRAGEQGSVALAMTVVMLLTLLTVGLMTRSQNSLLGAVGDSDRAGAAAAAEQGLAEAVARIDAGERTSFVGSGSVPGGTFDYEAVPDGGDDFVVYAEAEVDGATRAVQGTIGGRPKFPYSLFVATRAELEGNLGSINGRIGTNGVVDDGSTSEVQDLYGPDARCDRCRSPRAFETVREVSAPRPPDLSDVRGGRYQPCPDDGIFTGVLNGQGGIPVVCDPAQTNATDILFSDAIVVTDGPLIIHVLEGLDVSFVDTRINAGGRPSDVQLLLGGDRGTSAVVFEGARIDGIIYAPGRIAGADRTNVTGSFTIGELVLPRGATLNVNPSTELDSYEVSGWRLSSWEPVRPR